VYFPFSRVFDFQAARKGVLRVFSIFTRRGWAWPSSSLVFSILSGEEGFALLGLVACVFSFLRSEEGLYLPRCFLYTVVI